MRIEAYTQVQQLYNAKKPVKVQDKAKTAGSDRIQISSIGKDIQIAKNAVGTYQVSGESFAEKLMKKYEEIESL